MPSSPYFAGFDTFTSCRTAILAFAIRQTVTCNGLMHALYIAHDSLHAFDIPHCFVNDKIEKIQSHHCHIRKVRGRALFFIIGINYVLDNSAHHGIRLRRSTPFTAALERLAAEPLTFIIGINIVLDSSAHRCNGGSHTGNQMVHFIGRAEPNNPPHHSAATQTITSCISSAELQLPFST